VGEAVAGEARGVSGFAMLDRGTARGLEVKGGGGCSDARGGDFWS